MDYIAYFNFPTNVMLFLTIDKQRICEMELIIIVDIEERI